MPDSYEQARSLQFPALASALGLDIHNYRQRKHGQEFYGPCPIHNPKQNSTSFSYAQDGKFHCFSCDAKGRGAIDLTKLVKKLGFKEAVELLGSVPQALFEKAASNANPDATGDISTQADVKPMQKDTWRKFSVACPWLEERIPDAGIREKYGVFCYNNPARKSAYSNRVMIPVKDIQGNLYGYLGRAWEEEMVDQPEKPDTPKYLFPKNLPKSRFLFGAAEIAAGTFGPAPLKRVFLVESPFCVMKFAALGLPALSPFGWSVSPEQLELLAQLAKGILHLPDRDKYEESARVASFLATRLWLRFPSLPAGIDDPEQMTREQVLAL